MRMRWQPLVVIVALALRPVLSSAVAAPAPAALPDGLDATLQKLAGTAPVTGTLAVNRISVHGKGAKARRSEAGITFDVSAARGITLRVPGGVLAQAEQQIAAHQRDPELPMPTAEMLGDVNVVQAQRMLDPAAVLRAVLIGAKLLQQTSTTLDGVPATLLRFDLPLRATKSERAMVKSYHDELALWLDAHGVPLGYTQNTKTDIGWFLLNADTDRSEQGRFQVVAGRLVTTRLDVQQIAGALGHHGSTTTRYTLRVKASAPAGSAACARSRPPDRHCAFSASKPEHP